MIPTDLSDMTQVDRCWTEAPDGRNVDVLGITMASAGSVAELGCLGSCIGKRIGKRIVVPGVMNKMFAFSPRISPRAINTGVFAKITGKH